MPRMPRPQFTLRALLVAMLLVAVGCVVAPPALRVYAEYRERREIEELIQLIKDTVAAET